MPPLNSVLILGGRGICKPCIPRNTSGAAHHPAVDTGISDRLQTCAASARAEVLAEPHGSNGCIPPGPGFRSCTEQVRCRSKAVIQRPIEVRTSSPLMQQSQPGERQTGAACLSRLLKNPHTHNTSLKTGSKCSCPGVYTALSHRFLPCLALA